jgi:beta-glucosidase
MLFQLALLPLIVIPSLADVITGIPDSAPPGYEEWISPVVVPAKNVTGAGDWGWAVQRARQTIAGLTLEEKVNVTTGQDLYGRCVGNTGVRYLSTSISFLQETVYPKNWLAWSLSTGI